MNEKYCANCVNCVKDRGYYMCGRHVNPRNLITGLPVVFCESERGADDNGTTYCGRVARYYVEDTIGE